MVGPIPSQKMEVPIRKSRWTFIMVEIAQETKILRPSTLIVQPRMTNVSKGDEVQVQEAASSWNVMTYVTRIRCKSPLTTTTL